MIARADKRKPNELRPVKFELDYVRYPEGSVLVSFGDTRVLCNVSIEQGVPPWMKSQKKPGGWITAEYSMLPRATHTRNRREFPYPKGRTQEIARLIGRSLRNAVDLSKIGERTITIDCDVIQADGGTRTASITGGYVALAIALKREAKRSKLPNGILLSPVAAVSVGIVNRRPLLDLAYEEDSNADLDANLVINGDGEIIEFQCTAEKSPCAQKDLTELLKLGCSGASQLIKAQKIALKGL